MKTRQLLLAVLTCLFLGGTSVSQNVTFEASVDRSKVGLGEQFTLTLVLSGQTMGGGKNLQLPDLSKFHIMSGPNQSSSMQIINGAVSSSVAYSYVLQPRETGKMTIGPASIEAGGNTYRTDALTIEVVRGATRPRQPSASGEAASPDMAENLFLRAVVDRTRVTQGEQINSRSNCTRASLS